MIDWLTSISGEARVALGIPYFLFAFYVWFKTAISIKGMYDNILEKDSWSFFSLFSSSEFNEEGNYYRRETQKYSLLFVLIIGGMVFCIYLLGGFK